MCRQLGWSAALSSTSRFQRVNSAGRTLLEHVSCTGNEVDISDCLKPEQVD